MYMTMQNLTLINKTLFLLRAVERSVPRILQVHFVAKDQQHIGMPISPCRSADRTQHEKSVSIPAQDLICASFPPIFILNQPSSQYENNDLIPNWHACLPHPCPDLFGIHVDCDSRCSAKVTGKLDPDGETSDISFGDHGFFE